MREVKGDVYVLGKNASNSLLAWADYLSCLVK